MSSATVPPGRSSTLVDHIPIIWFEPVSRRPSAQLVIWLPGLGGTKEAMIPHLQDLAAAGFVALSFDPWQHAARGTEAPMDLATRVFSNFRRHMWPILGQTTLDTLRVIDWAVQTLGVDPHIAVGGISIGGDIAVAVAGLDQRIQRVAAIVATPDWLRPGMQDVFQPGRPLPPGEPDAYAQYFYDHLNPSTHLEAYTRGPAITFVCAADDTHVPLDGALRFQAALAAIEPSLGDRIRVTLVPEMGHLDCLKPIFWQHCLAWFTQA